MPTNIKDLRDLNTKLNQWEAYYQVPAIESRPIYVQIPTGTKCNLKCVFCTDRGENSPINYKDLSFEEFLPFADVISLSSLLQLYGWGEPLMNRDYEKIFDYVVEKYPGIHLYISTNGVLLSEEWIQKLVSQGNICLNVSLNAATPETYSALMKADKFDKVVQNLRNLKKAMKDAKGVSLSLSFVALRNNIHELPDFIDLAAELGASVMVQDLNIINGEHLNMSLVSEPDPRRIEAVLREANRRAIEKKVPFGYYGSLPITYSALCYSTSCTSGSEQAIAQASNAKDPSSQVTVSQSAAQIMQPPPGMCYDPWQRFMVGIDGSVSPCCRSKMIMGNLYQQSWQDIWNSPSYQHLRSTVNSAIPPQECASCPVRLGK